MTERERLIELLWGAIPTKKDAEDTADFLLEKGVIVPPCKMGDDLWWIDDKNTIHKQEKAVKGIMLCDDGKWKVIDKDGCLDEVDTQYAYLTREKAEETLKGSYGERSDTK